MPRPKQTGAANHYGPVESEEQWRAEGWSEKGIPASGSTRLTSIVSLRLDYETAQRYRKAARTIGKTLSEYLRQGGDELADQVEKECVQPAIRVTGIQMMFGETVKTTASPSAPATEVDRPITGFVHERETASR